ncbi:hypothetical protein [Sediminibacterium sp.]|uniref:hypothetical protein n=1 Tax=Sediminibacterium sp. TaxID=1917865 RepID=UPI0025E0C54E|nr:hypothetical protein [Sediminibacterium sp.]MBW0177210.1 hypothetical protein [Sediminibacterium sp.]
MKKVIVLAMAAFLVTGIAFAGGDHKHDGKKCAKAKECSKEGKDCCSKDAKKETKEVKEVKKTTAKKSVKA